MKYTIRTKKAGILIAEVKGRVANGIMSHADGVWREYKTDNYDGNCFELTEDCSYTLHQGITVFLWAGYLIIPDKS